MGTTIMDSSRIILTAFVFVGYLLLRAAMLCDEVAHKLPSFRMDAPPETPRTPTWAIILNAAILAGCAYWSYPRLFH